MRKLSLLFVVAFGLFVNSCGDSTSPDTNGGDANFRIVAVDPDSAYWGETVTVTLRNTQQGVFKLFLGAMEVEVRTASREADGTATLTFQVPESASTGLIRVYQHDTIEAKESRTLVVLEKLRSEMEPSFDHFAPGRVYTGDLFAITGRDIPMRWRDMEVKIGDVPLEIISWDEFRIFTRIPAAVQRGPVTLRMFDKVFNLGTVTKLEHSGSLASEGTLSSVRIYSARMQGTRRLELFSGTDTTVTETSGRISDVDFKHSFERITLARTGDSLIGVSEQTVEGIPMRLEIRLRLEPESRASGWVKLFAGHPGQLAFWEIELRSMRWILDNGVYILGTHSIDLPNELVSYRTGTLGTGRNIIETFRTGEPTSVINIDLRP